MTPVELQYIRIGLYLLGAIFSLALFAQLIRIRHSLARLLAVDMIGHLVNAGTLLVMLLFVVMLGEAPGWCVWVWTFNALIVAIVPIALFAWFMRDFDGHG